MPKKCQVLRDRRRPQILFPAPASGRVAVIEVLKMNEGLDEMIARTATRREMHEAAVEAGFRELAEDGIRHVMNGLTSISEISRVVDLTARVG